MANTILCSCRRCFVQKEFCNTCNGTEVFENFNLSVYLRSTSYWCCQDGDLDWWGTQWRRADAMYATDIMTKMSYFFLDRSDWSAVDIPDTAWQKGLFYLKTMQLQMRDLLKNITHFYWRHPSLPNYGCFHVEKQVLSVAPWELFLSFQQ